MSNVFASPLAATDVCVRVLRRLLDDEVEKFAQFSYVVENIHNPIIDNCGARHTQRGSALPFPCASSEEMDLGKSIVSDYLIGKMNNNEHVSNDSPSDSTTTGEGGTSTNNVSGDFSGSRKVLPAQPAVIPHPRTRSGGAAVAKAAVGADTNKGHTSHTNNNTKHVGGVSAVAAAAHSSNNFNKGARGKHSAAPSPAGAPALKTTRVSDLAAPTQPILTWSHYWELFANTSTLHAAHAAVIRTLKAALLKLTAQLDQLQREEEEAEDADGLQDRTAGSSSAVLPLPSSPSVTSAGMLPAPLPLRAPQSSAAPTIENSANSHASASYVFTDAYKEMKQIVLGFFQSPEMQHYTVEYMMYTNNYARSIAPRTLELARLWRWSVGAVAAPGRRAVSPSVALAQLTPTDRATLLQFSPFLDFLFRSFGDQGVPADVRVNLTGMPEQNKTPAAGGGSGPGGPKRQHAQGGKASNNVQQRAAAQLPAMPSDWDGFFTFLMLMATPLADLRRYTHVARCLLSSGVLAPADRLALYQDFLTPAVQRLGDATAVVMEDLAQHDVASILALMEDSSSITMGDASAEESIAAWNKYRNAPCDDRVLVHYGRVEKRFRRGKHTRLLFLFSDALCYAEELSTGRLRPRGFMPLDTVRVVSVADVPSSDIHDCFEIITSQTKRFIFFTSSPEQKRQWMDAIRYAVKQRNRVRVSGVNAARSHARRFLFQVTNYTNVQVSRPSEERSSSNANNHNNKNNTTNGSPKSGDAKATAAAGDKGSGLDDLLRQMRSTAPTLPYRSRLARQRQYDQEWQHFVDVQRAVAAPEAPAAAATAAVPPLPPAAAATSHTDLLPLNAQPSTATAALSTNGSFALSVGRSVTAHRQLEYDVTPWVRQSSMRRLQNQEMSMDRAASNATPVSAVAGAAGGPSESPKLQSSLPAYPRRQITTSWEPAGGGSSKADNASNSSRHAAATPVHRLLSERFDSARVTPHSSRQGSSDVADKTSVNHLQVSPSAAARAGAGAAVEENEADAPHIHIDDEDFASLKSNFSRSHSSSSGSSGDLPSAAADAGNAEPQASNPGDGTAAEEGKPNTSTNDLRITFSSDEEGLNHSQQQQQQQHLESPEVRPPAGREAAFSPHSAGPAHGEAPKQQTGTAPRSSASTVNKQLVVEEEDDEQSTTVTVTAFRRPNASQNMLLASTPISASPLLSDLRTPKSGGGSTTNRNENLNNSVNKKASADQKREEEQQQQPPREAPSGDRGAGQPNGAPAEEDEEQTSTSDMVWPQAKSAAVRTEEELLLSSKVDEEAEEEEHSPKANPESEKKKNSSGC